MLELLNLYLALVLDHFALDIVGLVCPESLLFVKLIHLFYFFSPLSLYCSQVNHKNWVVKFKIKKNRKKKNGKRRQCGLHH